MMKAFCPSLPLSRRKTWLRLPPTGFVRPGFGLGVEFAQGIGRGVYRGGEDGRGMFLSTQEKEGKEGRPRWDGGKKSLCRGGRKRIVWKERTGEQAREVHKVRGNIPL